MGFLDFFKENKIEDKKLIIFVFSLMGLAKIDGGVSVTELENIRSVFSKYKISESRVKKIIESCEKKYAGEEGIEKFFEDLEELSKKDKLELFDEMVVIAASDGEIKKEEVDFIENMGINMGIEQTSGFKNFIRLHKEEEKWFDFQPKGEFKEEYYSNGNLKSVKEIKEGKANGLYKSFYESGEILGGGKFINGKQEGLWRSYHKNGEKRRNNIFKNNIIISLMEWNDSGVLIKEFETKDGYRTTKKYEDDGKIYEESIHENNGFIDNEGDLVFKKKWSEDGDYIESEERRGYGIEGGELIEKYTNEKYNVQSFYSKEGKLTDQLVSDSENSHEIKWDIDGRLIEEKMNGFHLSEDISTFKKYYDSGQLEIEIKSKDDEEISNRRWGKNGNLIEENAYKEGDTRYKIHHEIMTRGEFEFELENGKEMTIYAQHHRLFKEEQCFEDGCWDFVDNEFIDEFYLTDYEDGYRFDEESLYKFFDSNAFDWNYEGYSSDWCGIEEFDSNETREKKWETYKSKFPELTKRDQFRVMND